MNRSSRVLAKYALLLPPVLSHLRQRDREATKAASPPATHRRRSSANWGAKYATTSNLARAHGMPGDSSTLHRKSRRSSQSSTRSPTASAPAAGIATLGGAAAAGGVSDVARLLPPSPPGVRLPLPLQSSLLPLLRLVLPAAGSDKRRSIPLLAPCTEPFVVGAPGGVVDFLVASPALSNERLRGETIADLTTLLSRAAASASASAAVPTTDCSRCCCCCCCSLCCGPSAGSAVGAPLAGTGAGASSWEMWGASSATCRPYSPEAMSAVGGRSGSGAGSLPSPPTEATAASASTMGATTLVAAALTAVASMPLVDLALAMERIAVGAGPRLLAPLFRGAAGASSLPLACPL
mmetsp:Transcript_2095/g.6204  ORF Transcript_2095/g.6204 Transcript_2095/m.6204 type:complete len:351 (-) Transcript_2095:5080-6132(-)